MPREYFCAYHSYLNAMEQLNDEERGRLFTALLVYSQSGTVPELTGNERFIFPSMRWQIDRDTKQYTAKCEKQAQNARKRWDATACNGIPTHAKDAKTKEKEKEKAKAKEKEKENKGGVGESPTPDKPPRARFVPPDEAELIAFFREAGSDKAEAEAFRDYYEANGWKVGKNSMKDWKAAARGWIRRSGQYNRGSSTQSAPTAWEALDKAAERIECGDFTFMEV